MTTATRRRKAATPKQRAAREEKMTALKSQLDQAVETLTSGDAWMTVLDGATRFTRYSFRNIMLILQQCPEATQVAGFHDWRKHGRKVRKGEKALYIFAPVTRKAEDNEDDKSRRLVGVRGTAVFDISQTDPIEGADPVGFTSGKLTGDAPAELWERLAVYAKTLGYTVEVGPCAPLNGWTDRDTRVIRVDDQHEGAAAAKVLLHEVAHIVAGHLDASDEEYRQHRGRIETEAESAAYIVAGALGLDTAPVSVNYIAQWASRAEDAAATLQAAGQTAVTTAKKILAAIEPDEDADEAV